MNDLDVPGMLMQGIKMLNEVTQMHRGLERRTTNAKDRPLEPEGFSAEISESSKPSEARPTHS